MPNKKRIWYEGAIYHITARGNKRDNIFLDEGDFQFFIAQLDFTKEKYAFDIYAYCIMTNHYHLQLRTGNKPIWQIMSYINIHYSKYFNKKYFGCGHVFQKRYTSSLIESDNYLLETSRYIHLNPVNARMVNKPSKYRWSSFGEYINDYTTKRKIILEDPILNFFEGNKREEYKIFVESASLFHDLYVKIEKEMEKV